MITINETEYDETDLEDEVKFAISQLQLANKTIAALRADLVNQQILAQHHSKFIEKNLPSSDDSKSSSEDSDSDEDA